jgi:hypothetical protein
MAQMGHTDASLALEIYSKVMERKRDTGARMERAERPPERVVRDALDGVPVVLREVGVSPAR